MTTTSRTVTWLEALGASRDVVEYAATVEGGPEVFWGTCPRGDWLLAIAVRTRGQDTARRDAVLRAAVAVAGLGLDYLPDDDTLACAVLANAARGVDDLAAAPRAEDIDDLEREADDAPDPSVSYARRAIVVVARALTSPTDLDDVAMVPSLLAQAAAHDAGDCAMLSAASFVLQRSSELVRAHVAAPLLGDASSEQG